MIQPLSPALIPVVEDENGGYHAPGGYSVVNRTVRLKARVFFPADAPGVTDPAQIAAEALAYTQKGIYLSTIGLGLEFNDALLNELARQGQGGRTSPCVA